MIRRRAFLSWLYLKESKAWMEEEGRDEKVASSKEKPIGILECENRYPIYYQNRAKMARIDTLFMTKMAEKPYPLGLQIPIYPIYIVREHPPPHQDGALNRLVSISFLTTAHQSYNQQHKEDASSNDNSYLPGFQFWTTRLLGR